MKLDYDDRTRYTWDDYRLFLCYS